MMHRTDDIRIKWTKVVLPPVFLEEEMPLTERASSTVNQARNEVSDILHGRDHRLLVVASPLASLWVARSRTGQTISLCVVLATNVGDREIERPGQLPTDPIQGIESRTAATVLAAHLLDHYFGI